jgi:signal peptidase I
MKDNAPVSDFKEVPKKGKWREYGESLLIALLIAFFIRSFGVEAFKIPSGSMIPTLMIGDHIFVNKFIYGLRIPFTKTKIVKISDPKRGEPIVFMFPLDNSKDFIKRVVGVPGDRIQIEGDRVSVNGVFLSRDRIKIESSALAENTSLQIIPTANAAVEDLKNGIPYHPGWENYDYFFEENGEKRYLIQLESGPSYDRRQLRVPPGYLFVMGDNRDNSSDSREWGFVPLENVKGRAMFVWLSIDFNRGRIRWRRFGHWLH